MIKKFFFKAQVVGELAKQIRDIIDQIVAYI